MKETKEQNIYGSEDGSPMPVPDLPANGPAAHRPEKDGYVFVGWYIDPELTKRINPNGMLPHTVDLYPKWEPKRYHIRYLLEEGENSSANPHLYTVEDGLIKLYPASCEGRQFFGWFLEDQLVDYIDPSWKRDVTLRGVFQAFTQVAFDSGRGTRIQPVQTDENGQIHPDLQPFRPGYQFGGWYYNRTWTRQWKPEDRFTRPAVLYAKWTPLTYTMTLDPNGGYLEGEREYHFTSDTPSFTLPVPYKKNCRFLGWFDSRGNQHLIVRKGMISDVSLKAGWSEPVKEVIYVPGAVMQAFEEKKTQIIGKTFSDDQKTETDE